MAAFIPVVGVARQLNDREHQDVHPVPIFGAHQPNAFREQCVERVADLLPIVAVDRVALLERRGGLRQEFIGSFGQGLPPTC